MNWLPAVLVIALAVLIIAATVWVMRRRHSLRAVGREAEALNILSNGTRRAFWMSSADHFDTSDSSASDGGDGGD